MNSHLIVFGIILAFGLASGKSFQRLIIKDATLEVKSNPYVKSIVVTISGEYNETLTIDVPVYEKLPEDIILNTYITYNGEPLSPLQSSLCELFDDKKFAPDVLDAGVPEGKFPRECPVFPNKDYAVVNYTFPPEKLGPAIPDGELHAEIHASRTGDDSDAFAILRVDASLVTVTPDASSLVG